MTIWQPDPCFYPSPRQAEKAPPENLAYVAAFDPDADSRDAHRGRRRRSEIGHLFENRRQRRDAKCRRRAASFRLERLLLVPVPECAPSACRAALPGRPGPSLLAHLHHRHQTRPAPAPDRQDDRAGGGRRQDRLYAPAHHPLRPRRHLCHRARQRATESARRHLRHGPRKLRAARPLGGRARAAAARL